MGRYRKAGPVKVTDHRHAWAASSRSSTFRPSSPANSGDESYAFVEKLWAMRRIGDIIDELDLKGKNDELIKELVELSTKHGILTPYTSFLADENTDFRRLDEQRGARRARTCGPWTRPPAWRAWPSGPRRRVSSMPSSRRRRHLRAAARRRPMRYPANSGGARSFSAPSPRGSRQQAERLLRADCNWDRRWCETSRPIGRSWSAACSRSATRPSISGPPTRSGAIPP